MNDAFRPPVNEDPTPTTHDRDCAHGTDNPDGRCMCADPCCQHRDGLGWTVCVCAACNGRCGLVHPSVRDTRRAI
jgi:hypothetical protein